ncbi:MAG: 3-hydroxybutyryl-CoA dehydratase [Thermoanaerobacterales bacterium 50_218]|nr:MAG: 3-hydroxybutyryl-CoA dehydratase [Thermoanaerobacterales bacterium 50_218]HAA90178.1 crotonase [Peptococcaceae bacterium]
MTYKNILLDKEENLAVITINRPQVLNALNAELLHELEDAIENLATDSRVRVLILTGAGDKAFVAGADIAYMQNMTVSEGKEFGLLGQRVFKMIEDFPKPTIAAVNGYALGGGCELAMVCDIRVASDNAKFGQPEVSLGIIPGFGGTQRLVRLVGPGKAKELIYTGEIIDAQTAFQIGLVNHVVKQDELLSFAKELAKRIVGNAPLALRYAKEAINNGMEMDLERGLMLEANLFGVCFSSLDQKEGMKAFLERRKPSFQGK